MGLLMQTAGVAAQAAGVAALYWCWRARRVANGPVLAAGWGLILLGAVPWLPGVSVERALAIAMLAPMVAGLLLLAPDALPRLAGRSARRARPARQAEAEGEAGEPPPGARARSIARWTGGLLAAPALALAAMALTLAAGPGGFADRAALSMLALTVAGTAALLWLLASERPWRAVVSVGAAAAAVSVLTLVLTLNGSSA